MNKQYALIDSGNGRKLEQFGPYLICRPCAQAVFAPKLQNWQIDAEFTREGENRWIKKKPLPDAWTIEVSGIQFKISPTDFGHLGIFPEQKEFWAWMTETIRSEKRPVEVLNLFAYSGGATLACAKGGAKVCHLDASKGMVAWARENAALNQLQEAPIRWIIEDVGKFLKREIKRGHRYDAVILDPPSFGRGAQGEVFKIEEHLPEILSLVRALLTDRPLFIDFSCHTPGFSPLVMHHLLAQTMTGLDGKIDFGEMVLQGQPDVFPGVLPLPSGTFARWFHA